MKKSISWYWCWLLGIGFTSNVFGQPFLGFFERTSSAKVQCPPFLKVSISGEGVGCLSDLRMWNTPPYRYDYSLGSILAAGDRVYTISGAKGCSKEIYLSFNTNSTDRGEIKDLVRRDSLNLCRSDPKNQNCTCEILIDNGSSTLNRSTLDAFVSEEGSETNKSLAFDSTILNPESSPVGPAQSELQIDNTAPKEEKARDTLNLAASTREEASGISETDTNRELPKRLSRRKVALVIGNDNYRNVPKLNNARFDARSVGQTLKSIGYEVHTAMDLTEKAFKKKLRDFEADLQGGEEVIFFYAGHGVEVKGTNFLLPTDVGNENERQIEDEGIPLQRVLDDFSSKRAIFTLAVIDACRDNPFKQTGRSIGGRGLAPTQTASGQMIVYSAGVGQQALDTLGDKDVEKNGVFTRVFVRKIREPGVPVHQLMREVRSEVANLAKSIGHEQIPALYDQAIGDYFLREN